MGNKIAHLKLHTEYSLLEGVGKIEEYIEKVKALEIDTLAITDVSMFGAIEFYKKCKKSGIKPIIGLEVFIEGFTLIDDYSLVLLAKNKNGYRKFLVKDKVLGREEIDKLSEEEIKDKLLAEKDKKIRTLLKKQYTVNREIFNFKNAKLKSAAILKRK